MQWHSETRGGGRIAPLATAVRRLPASAALSRVAGRRDCVCLSGVFDNKCEKWMYVSVPYPRGAGIIQRRLSSSPTGSQRAGAFDGMDTGHSRAALAAQRDVSSLPYSLRSHAEGE